MAPLKINEQEIFVLEKLDLDSITPTMPDGIGRAHLIQLGRLI